MNTHSIVDGLERAEGEEPEFTWSEVARGFYAGSCEGNFVGYIERNARGAFVAHDMQSRVRGKFPTIDDAIENLTAFFLSPEEPEEEV
ncbi:hypothetical protein HMPREF0290_2406 [Corynebacterium efficiens YS-314]|uniref:Uncharacterized protein n=1 Tax=Corynebacterium efficiens (strain DSM 44549 / YS-314 / AJ 12310 / JCM 11189 / NBRC 100395) TaxID=196164 RepID=Q8FMY3_COREF|nr:hypothetical protein [Corynebacterium efficiens]EEW49035.1 hypothetical protein HMPREF0290_2406 [Corynebacterium efficiens YS-314]BAC19176.1 hypothetical protein [Corynebacterium efficiens YS-314]